MRRTLLAGLLVLAACSTEVAAGLDEAQSQRALAALAEAGIGADRQSTGDGKDRTYRIEVSSADAGKAASVLLSHGLPRAEKKGFSSLYGTSSMIPTATEEKARFLDALSGEISTLLEGLEGVSEARALVTRPEDDPLAPPDKPRAQPTASVLLKVRESARAPAPEDVRRLVAGAVEGMVPDNVTVVTETVPAVKSDAPLLDRVWFLRVARASKGSLVGVLAGAFVVILLLALWILVTARKVARLRAQILKMGGTGEMS